MRPNRYVERDPFPSVNRPQVAVWHSAEEGDLKELMFLLPKAVSELSRDKAFLKYGRDWLERGARQGWAFNPNGRVNGLEGMGVICHGPYPALELGELDKQVYVITVRARRTRPEMMSVDDFERLIAAQPTGRPGLGKIYGAAAKLPPDVIEQQVRATAAAEKKVERHRAEIEQKQQDRRELGLPPFNPDDNPYIAEGLKEE